MSVYITIKQAKEFARVLNGRLPRVGWETCVVSGSADSYVIDLDGRRLEGEFMVRVWLSNEGGRFRTRDEQGMYPLSHGYGRIHS